MSTDIDSDNSKTSLIDVFLFYTLWDAEWLRQE